MSLPNRVRRAVVHLLTELIALHLPDRKGAHMALHNYRRLIDGLASPDGLRAFTAIDIVDADTIRLRLDVDGTGSAEVVLTGSQADELAEALDGAIDTLNAGLLVDDTPDPDTSWNERAAGYVTRLAAQMIDPNLADEGYQRLHDEIHDLSPDDAAALADALLLRASATLASFRDYVLSGEKLVAIANQAAQ